MELLKRLRADLQHFESNSGFGEEQAVEAIRGHLQVRIREAEGAVRALDGEAAVTRPRTEAA